MKKWMVVLLALLLLGCLAACGSEEQEPNASEPSAAEPPAVPERGKLPETSEPAAPSLTDAAPEPAPASGSRTLVVYFSATNNTEGVAQHIADILGAERYEIVPETAYTAADLDWHDSSSRTSVEMNDPNSRPSISGSAENMEEYDVIFLGYPIWWGQAPKIVSTFLESYDFSGKTIIPFCTSGSSGIGSSAVNLHELAGAATWLDGQRFSGGASESQVKTWLESLDLEF